MRYTHSIVIPTKDRPKLLRRAVASALEELGPEGEIVIIDDHSQPSARQSLADIGCPRLRIFKLPPGETGISDARNAGIATAVGDLIFFLDDDDEFESGYCAHVLSQAANTHDYGFSAFDEIIDASGQRHAGAIRFAEGPIPPNAPLRKQLCGFGMGFWMWRSVALQTGMVARDLKINEDTDYLCRLIAAGRRGWYSARVGVVLHHHKGDTAELTHLTDRTSAQERADCMLAMCNRYPQMVNHLGAGYIRHCLKTDRAGDIWTFIRQQADWRIRSRLRVFAAVKSCGYWMARRRKIT